MPRPKEEILFEWVCPREVLIQYARREIKRLCFVIAPRMLAIITVLLAILYFVFDCLFPPNLDFNLFGIFLRVWLFGVLLSGFVGLIGPWLNVLEHIRYRITEKNIRVVGGEYSKIFKWQDLKGFMVSADFTLAPVQICIKLFTADRSATLYLSQEGLLADRVVHYVTGRIPLLSEPPDSFHPIHFTMLQKLSLAIGTLIYSLGVAFYTVFYAGPIFMKKGFLSPLFIVIISLLGPGTICSALIFGRSFFKNKTLKVYAVLTNFVSIGLVMLFWVILLLWKIRRDVGGW